MLSRLKDSLQKHLGQAKSTHALALPAIIAGGVTASIISSAIKENNPRPQLRTKCHDVAQFITMHADDRWFAVCDRLGDFANIAPHTCDRAYLYVSHVVTILNLAQQNKIHNTAMAQYCITIATSNLISTVRVRKRTIFGNK